MPYLTSQLHNTGQALLSSEGSFVHNLRMSVGYVISMLPYALVVGGVCAAQTLLCIWAIRRHRTFQVATGGRFQTDYFTVGWDGVLFALVFPISVAVLFPRAAILLLYTGFFYCLAGGGLYMLWALTFEYMMRKTAVLGALDLVRLALQDVMVGHEWLDNCSIVAAIDDTGTVARLSGNVRSKDQLSTASFAALKVRGIRQVDTEDLHVGRPRKQE